MYRKSKKPTAMPWANEKTAKAVHKVLEWTLYDEMEAPTEEEFELAEKYGESMDSKFARIKASQERRGTKPTLANL